MDANLLNKIKSLADQLTEAGKTMTRADLAYELKDFGYDSDSNDITKVVDDAYDELYDNDHDAASRLLNVFRTNDGRLGLPYAQLFLNKLLDGDTAEIADYLNLNLNQAKEALDLLDDELHKKVRAVKAKATSLMSKIDGSADISLYKEEISNLFEQYSALVGQYHESQKYVCGVIDDFVKVRDEVLGRYRESAMRLVDIFGDGVKVIDPELFDFDSIQWLDVDSKLQSVALEYARLSEQCSTLIASISDSFKNMVNYVATSLRMGGIAGAFGAAFEILGHYSDAKERSNQLGMEVDRFRTSVSNDANLIKTDLMRMLAIYKTLNDYFIPKAVTFIRYAVQLMEDDYTAMTSSLYEDPQIKPLDDERWSIVSNLRSVETDMLDHEQQIAFYTTKMTELDEGILSKRDKYISVKESEPRPPFLLSRILSFGKTWSSFCRDFAEWYQKNGLFIRQFDEDRVEVKLCDDQIAQHRLAVEGLKVKRDELVAALNAKSLEIRQLIAATPEVKERLLTHLRSYVALLRLGREVAESKLSPELVNTVSVYTEPSSESDLALAITPEQEEGISRFKQELGERGVWGQALAKGVSLAESYVKLAAQERQGQIDRERYDNECEKIRQNLRDYIQQVDDKSGLLREVLRKANLAETPEERKDALSLMSEVGGLEFSDEEYEDFLNGNGQISL